MLKAYKYRLYPNKDQADKIDDTINVCRLVYNLALDIKITAWKQLQVNLSAYTIKKDLVGLAKEYAWVRSVDSQALQSSVLRVDAAFKNFFNGSGYPKFKKKSDSGSFQCHSVTKRIDWENKTLTIPKIKNIPISLSRKFNGEIRTITISKTLTGKYFASILVLTEQLPPNPPQKANAIGIDLGISNFATISNGDKIKNDRFLGNSIYRLKILQRRVAKKKNGSNNRKKANKRVSLLHEKITNQRNDFLHKLSTKLISDNQTDTICVESLAVKNMIRNHSLAQSIGDVAWGEFVRQLDYKAKWHGKNLIKIDRFYASSKTCSNCGQKHNELHLSEREWICQNCGTNHDRDVNAAINIRNSGMGSPVEPVELPSMEGAVKQESKLLHYQKLSLSNVTQNNQKI